MPTRKFFAVPMRQRKLVISLPGGDNPSSWKLVSADIRAYTSMGDRVADSYALMPGHGFKRLIELRTFIAAMESVPDWLDMAMVEDGTRLERAMCSPRAYSCQRDAICSGRGTLPSGVSLSTTPGSAVESCRSSSSSLIPARSAIDLIVCGPIALPRSSAAIGLF